MAWSVDRSSLGTASGDAGSTIDLVTTQSVASGAWIFAVVGWRSAATLNSLSGGSLTWEIVASHTNAQSIAIVRAYAPSGLASSTTITATWSASTFQRKIGAASFAGGAAGSEVQDTGTGGASTAAWSATADTTTNNALVIGVSGQDSNTSSTPDGNSTELVDFQQGGSSAATMVYRIVTGTGASTVGGTWSAAVAWASLAAAFSLDPPAVIGGGGWKRPGRERGRFPSRDQMWIG
jgi:hypothetical protein